MKLISNKNYDSIKAYLAGVDFPNKWTIDNPAIFHQARTGKTQTYICSPSCNYMLDYKYLLLKFDGQIEYKIYSNESSKKWNHDFQLFFYDYLNYLKSDVLNQKKYIYCSSDETKDYLFLKFDNPMYVLIQIVPYSQNALNNGCPFYFSNTLLEFDYSDHYVRDLNRIDGTSWHFNGKVNSPPRLSLINRLHKGK